MRINPEILMPIVQGLLASGLYTGHDEEGEVGFLRDDDGEPAVISDATSLARDIQKKLDEA